MNRNEKYEGERWQQIIREIKFMISKGKCKTIWKNEKKIFTFINGRAGCANRPDGNKYEMAFWKKKEKKQQHSLISRFIAKFPQLTLGFLVWFI